MDYELYKSVRDYIMKNLTKKSRLTPNELAQLLKELRKIS